MKYSIVSHQAHGFTLIELMVVVVLIAILSTVSVVQLDTQRMRGRDVSRKESVAEYQTAIEAYYGKQRTYFIEDKSVASNTCVVQNQTAIGYSIIGAGAGCVGVHGSGQGNMNRANEITIPLSQYLQPNSIAQALINDGVLVQSRQDPLTSKDGTVTDKSYGFFLTLCQENSAAAISKATATNYALFIRTEIVSAYDTNQSKNRCGGSLTTGAWNILQNE